MKRLFALLLTLAMVFTLFACGKKDTQSTAETEPSETTPAETKPGETTSTQLTGDPKALIAQGKYEEAYKILYANKSDPAAAELLKDFMWVCGKTVSTNSDGMVTTTEYTYDAAGNKIKQAMSSSDGMATTREYTYDAAGNKTKEVRTDALGETWVYYECVYDASGNKIKEIEDGKTVEYEYDAAGNLIKEAWTEDGAVLAATEYTYDAAGNQIKSVATGLDGRVRVQEFDAAGNCKKQVDTDVDGKVTTIEYDAEKTVVMETVTYPDGKVEVFCESFYDAAGNRVKSVKYNKKDLSVYNTTEYTYDADGRPAKQVTTDVRGAVTTREYAYDAEGKEIKIVDTTVKDGTSTVLVVYEYSSTYDADGNLQITVIKDDKTDYIATYDKAGNEIKRSTPNSVDEGYEYTYDDYGNMIKQIRFSRMRGDTTFEYSDFKLFYKPAKK